LSHSKLAWGDPGFSAEPLSPPLSIAALVRRSSLPRCFFSPWQGRQFAWKIGNTVFSKGGASFCCADAGPPTAMNASVPQRTNVVRIVSCGCKKCLEAGAIWTNSFIAKAERECKSESQEAVPSEPEA
jgi:hypothetical protein